MTTPKPEAPSLFALMVTPITASIFTAMIVFHLHHDNAGKAVLYTVLALTYWFLVAFMARNEIKYRNAKED